MLLEIRDRNRKNLRLVRRWWRIVAGVVHRAIAAPHAVFVQQGVSRADPRSASQGQERNAVGRSQAGCHHGEIVRVPAAQAFVVVSDRLCKLLEQCFGWGVGVAEGTKNDAASELKGFRKVTSNQINKTASASFCSASKVIKLTAASTRTSTWTKSVLENNEKRTIVN